MVDIKGIHIYSLHHHHHGRNHHHEMHGESGWETREQEWILIMMEGQRMHKCQNPSFHKTLCSLSLSMT